MEENIEKLDVDETMAKDKIKELKELKKEIKGDNKKLKSLEKRPPARYNQQKRE